jgi:phosphoribosylformylglycinamidine cyclo-ligase
VRSVLGLIEKGVPVAAMAHITGGGIIGNLPRVIPEGLSARLESWNVPPAFRALQRLGDIADREMFSTFNMGVGYVLVAPEAEAARAVAVLQEAGEVVIPLGEIAWGAEKITVDGRP